MPFAAAKQIANRISRAPAIEPPTMIARSRCPGRAIAGIGLQPHSACPEGGRMHTGSCLCGAVKFSIEGELKPPDACHCSQCRKVSGHYWASTDVPRSALKVEGEFNVAWYRSSDNVQRG